MSLTRSCCLFVCASAITKVHFFETFSLLSELCFSNLAVPEAVFQLFHGEVDQVLYVCTHCELYYVAIVLGFSLIHANQLKICVNSVIPHLDCWAVIAVWSQKLPAFLLRLYPVRISAHRAVVFKW
jgi:hypothetical protein